jgi:hypothetical protein
MALAGPFFVIGVVDPIDRSVWRLRCSARSGRRGIGLSTYPQRPAPRLRSESPDPDSTFAALQLQVGHVRQALDQDGLSNMGRTMSVSTTAEQIVQANATDRSPVVFIHGLWLLPSSWDRWAAVFEEAGYTGIDAGMAG